MNMVEIDEMFSGEVLAKIFLMCGSLPALKNFIKI